MPDSMEIELVRVRDGPEARMVFSSRIGRQDGYSMIEIATLVDSYVCSRGGKQWQVKTYMLNGCTLLAEYDRGWLVRITVLCSS